MRRLVIAVGLAACGGGAPAPEDDAADAAPEAPDADDPARCMAPSPLGELPALTAGTAVIDAGDADGTYRIDYNAPVAETVLARFALREGLGRFAAGFATGAHPIAGDDAVVETCGLCLMLVTRYYEPESSQYLLATGGEVTFDRLDETATGRLAGVATGVTLTRIVYKAGAWLPDADCVTTIDRLPFDVALEPGPFYEPTGR